MTDKHTLVERSIRHYLDRIELRTNGSGWNSTKTSGHTVAEVPEWALRQWLDRITALEAREAELVERLSNAAEELEYFVEFARRQSEFEGDAEAGFAVVREARATLAKARQSDEGEA